MKNEHEESSKRLLGLLIGVVGAGALYYAYAEHQQKTPVLKKIGKTISEVGEMLEKCDLGSGCGMLESIEKKIPKGAEIVNNITEWVDLGLTLWKKFK